MFVNDQYDSLKHIYILFFMLKILNVTKMRKVKKRPLLSSQLEFLLIVDVLMQKVI